MTTICALARQFTTLHYSKCPKSLISSDLPTEESLCSSFPQRQIKNGLHRSFYCPCMIKFDNSTMPKGFTTSKKQHLSWFFFELHELYSHPRGKSCMSRQSITYWTTLLRIFELNTESLMKSTNPPHSFCKRRYTQDFSFAGKAHYSEHSDSTIQRLRKN